jgi:hypothetical protein
VADKEFLWLDELRKISERSSAMLHDPQFWFAAICAVASLIFIAEVIVKRWPF